MLRNTFIHVPSVGKNTEEGIWQSDILTWDEFVSGFEKLVLPERIKARLMDHVVESLMEYDRKNHAYFAKKLPAREHWRAYPDFKDRCCFLDIETTGMSKDSDDITLIGLYDGKKSRVFIKGKDLDEFADAIRKYSMIVTFNGTCFDLPFIQRKFPGIKFDHLHVDLRYAMRLLGYSGGLKKIEKHFSIQRDESVDGMDGLQAVRLWHKYKRGDTAALDLLVKYNLEDIENLKILMDKIFPRLKSKFFLDLL